MKSPSLSFLSFPRKWESTFKKRLLCGPVCWWGLEKEGHLFFDKVARLAFLGYTLFIDNKTMNKRGQSMIEYVLIAVLVILGIVIMGPYVLRSVNAHFKLWDYSVQDSFTETLTQAPVNAITNISTNCTCTTSAGSCGSSLSQCAANQREYDHTCNPQGCDGAPASSCVNDTTCCTTYSPHGCGTVPLGQSATSTNCNYGYQIQSQQCGSNTNISCVQDSICPLPACLGILSPGAIYCPNATTLLNQNYGLTYVADSSLCSNTPPCEVYCDISNGYLLNPTHTACTDTYTVAASLSSCAGGCNGPGQGCSSSGSPAVVTVNTCNFQMCADSRSIITAVSQTPQSGCGNGINDNPPGTPGTQCTVTVTY